MTQQNLLNPGCRCKRFSGCLHAARLVGSLVTVTTDPVSDRHAGVMQRLEPMPVRALLFQGSIHTLDHDVLLGAVQCGEYLAQPISLEPRPCNLGW